MWCRCCRCNGTVFFKPLTVKDLIAFFAPIANAASDLPFYYYNMPSMTGVSLSVADFLIEGKKVMSNLVGTKFTHNNLMEMKDCLALNNGEFEVCTDMMKFLQQD